MTKTKKIHIITAIKVPHNKSSNNNSNYSKKRNK